MDVALPKITNNHIHLWALIPIKKLLKKIKEVDPKLYSRIYIYKPQNPIPKSISDMTPVDSLVVADNNTIGTIQRSITDMNDWVQVTDENVPDYTMSNGLEQPFDQLNDIQKKVRVMIRNDNVYCYLWYYALLKNYINNVFYLNVRGKPGAISKAVKIDDIYLRTSKYVYSQVEFYIRMHRICGDNKNITNIDYPMFYKTYTKIKMESDIIINIVNLFNLSHGDMSKLDVDKIIDTYPLLSFPTDYKEQSKPLMCVQYIATMAKHNLDETIDKPKYYSQMRAMVYSCALINEQYGFTFFNGYDLVGHEQGTFNIMVYRDLIEEFSGLKGMDFFPHIGESSDIPNEIPTDYQYIIDKKIKRIGHGIAFIGNKKIADHYASQDIYIESCPISNYILGYSKPASHPHQKYVDHEHIKIMIGSDDNAPFGYSTVTNDYALIRKAWNLSDKQITKLIMNGIECVPDQSKKYYFDLHRFISQHKSV